MPMKKSMLALSIFFIILTFVGIAYVLSTKGRANAGYAIIPMLLALISIAVYRNHKNTS